MAIWRLLVWNLPPPTAAGIGTQAVGTLPAAVALGLAWWEGATGPVVLFALLLAWLVLRVGVLLVRRLRHRTPGSVAGDGRLAAWPASSGHPGVT
jgi:hypothetical protein